ncbi:hypothetical protein B0T14DRAFT_44687 [Immersiella caudata]|uniref:Uncharacterized protein n=1 Tax=Immersiella caudata TaxID=314043 RepID=A0AA39XF53_9PEZI|nr:hypothetical protein B0T14DRAFT_44687 [Immersiella caudata]
MRFSALNDLAPWIPKTHADLTTPGRPTQRKPQTARAESENEKAPSALVTPLVGWGKVPPTRTSPKWMAESKVSLSIDARRFTVDADALFSGRSGSDTPHTNTRAHRPDTKSPRWRPFQCCCSATAVCSLPVDLLDVLQGRLPNIESRVLASPARLTSGLSNFQLQRPQGASQSLWRPLSRRALIGLPHIDTSRAFSLCHVTGGLGV